MYWRLQVIRACEFWTEIFCGPLSYGGSLRCIYPCALVLWKRQNLARERTRIHPLSFLQWHTSSGPLFGDLTILTSSHICFVVVRDHYQDNNGTSYASCRPLSSPVICSSNYWIIFNLALPMRWTTYFSYVAISGDKIVTYAEENGCSSSSIRCQYSSPFSPSLIFFAFPFLAVFFFFLDEPLCQPHLWNAINPVCSCPVLQYNSPLDWYGRFLLWCGWLSFRLLVFLLDFLSCFREAIHLLASLYCLGSFFWC